MRWREKNRKKIKELVSGSNLSRHASLSLCYYMKKCLESTCTSCTNDRNIDVAIITEKLLNYTTYAMFLGTYLIFNISYHKEHLLNFSVN